MHNYFKFFHDTRKNVHKAILSSDNYFKENKIYTWLQKEKECYKYKTSAMKNIFFGIVYRYKR